MIISHKHKFLYIAPIKCASSTLRAALKPYADISSDDYNDTPNSFYHNNWHASAKDLKIHFEDMGWDWDTYFKFSFIRNPWDRLVSGYNYQKKVVHNKEKYGIDHLCYERYKKNTEHNCFNQWLRLKQLIHHTGAGSILVDEHDNYMVDYIGKVEKLQQDFDTLCDWIGIPSQQLPHKNKTNHKHYTEYYDNESREMIATRCARDIKAFGYKFGE